jgi:hypothetical protein
LFAALAEIANERTARGSVSGDSSLLGLRFLFRFGFRFQRWVGGADGFLPGADAAMNEIGFVADVFLAAEKELGEVGERTGAAGGNAAGGDKLEELANDMIDIGGAELAGDGREFLSDFVQLEELLLFASVDEAERGMGVVAEHAALAAIGERELTEFGLIDGVSGTG